MAIPQWVTGRSWPTFTVTPQTVAGDGTPADGTSASMAGLWDTFELRYDPETEEISAADAGNQNQVKLKNGWTASITTILRKGALTGLVNPLPSILADDTKEVYKIVVGRTSNLTAGAGTATWTGKFLKTGYVETGGKGRGTGVGTFSLVDDGTTGGVAYPGGSGQP